MELRHLRYFVTLAEELHFGRAAVRLGMSQPPLSQQIKQLEEELGVVLFHRSQRAVRLSSAGAWMLPRASRVLEEAQQLKDGVVRAARGAAGSMTLAFVSIADYAVLPELLRAMTTQFPEVALTLREATSDLQFEGLAEGRIDAGLLIPPVPQHLALRLDYMPLLSDALVAAVPSEVASGLAPGAVDVADLAGLPLVIFPRVLAPALYDQILGVFAARGQTPSIAQEAVQMQTLIGLVAGGLGLALVPSSMRYLKRPGVVYRRLRVPDSDVEGGLAWRRDNESAVLRAWIDSLRHRPARVRWRPA